MEEDPQEELEECKYTLLPLATKFKNMPGILKATRGLTCTGNPETTRYSSSGQPKKNPRKFQGFTH